MTEATHLLWRSQFMIEFEGAAKAIATVLALLGVGGVGFWRGKSHVQKTNAADAVTISELNGEVRLLERQERTIELREREIRELTEKANDRNALAVRVEMMSAQLTKMETDHAESLLRVERSYADRMNDFRQQLTELSQLIADKQIELDEQKAQNLELVRENAILRTRCAGCDKQPKGSNDAT